MRGFETLAVHQIPRARARPHVAPTKSGFRYNFSENCPQDRNEWARKLRLAILYNLREKSDPKLKN
jgi:hypothetical protein